MEVGTKEPVIGIRLTPANVEERPLQVSKYNGR
jgi:hypothetical protein